MQNHLGQVPLAGGLFIAEASEAQRQRRRSDSAEELARPPHVIASGCWNRSTERKNLPKCRTGVLANTRRWRDFKRETLHQVLEFRIGETPVDLAGWSRLPDVTGVAVATGPP
jgi:hypothetical protein